MTVMTARTVGPKQEGQVVWIKQPDFEKIFRFEWHPQTKRVFVIRLWEPTLIADPIALEIDNLGAGVNAVLIWLRGFKEGKQFSLNMTGDKR